MNNLVSLGGIVGSLFISLILFLLTIYALVVILRFFYFRKKEKLAKQLLEKGFSVVTSSSCGVPHLLEKNDLVLSVWEGKKYV